MAASFLFYPVTESHPGPYGPPLPHLFNKGAELLLGSLQLRLRGTPPVHMAPVPHGGTQPLCLHAKASLFPDLLLDLARKDGVSKWVC